MSTIELITQHFDENKKPLLALAKRQVGEFWFEDAVQETYCRALKHAGNKSPILSIDYYLKYILGTVCREYMQDNVTGEAEQLEEWMWEGDELEDEFKALGVVQCMLQDLQDMQEPERSCIYMHVVQGERSKVVSRITGVDEQNIRKMAERFRKAMKGKYGEQSNT